MLAVVMTNISPMPHSMAEALYLI